MRTAGTRLPGPDRLWKPWLSDAGDVYVWSLFCQNVTQVSVLVLKTTFTGFFEALSSTAYGLNFWHFNNFHFALLINETKANKACEARRLHRQCYLKALLFLLRSEHHDHLAAFDLRWEGFDHCRSCKSSFTRLSTSIPICWCAISRPRKRSVILALSPSSRKRIRLRSFT